MKRFALPLAFLVIVVIGIALPVFALAPEIPSSITPNDFPVSPDAHWLWAILASSTTMGIVTWIVSRAAQWILAWRQWKEGSAQAKCIRFLDAAVDNVYRTFVREAKAANAGGRLTVEQKNRALEAAIQEAREFAMQEGMDLVKIVGKEMLPALVERIISSRKTGGLVPPPLPDLALLSRSGV